LLAGLGYAARTPLLWRRLWTAAFALVALALLWKLIVLARSEIAAPPLWDFKVFWTVGHVAVAGRNVYDPASYAPFRALTNPAGDREFDAIALGIGMPYPPPVLLLFYPLGFFATISGALAAWYGLLFAALAAAIALVYRAFFAADGAAGALVAAVLVLLLPATSETFALGQLDVFALCLLVATWREHDRRRAGLWFAPLLLLRPFFIAFAIFFAARRNWTALGATALTLALLFALAAPLAGWNGLLTYATNNPGARYPQSYFSGSESLYKIVGQFDHHDSGYVSLAAHPAFVLLAVALLALAGYVCARGAATRPDACLGLVVALGLLLYPNTGTHYGMLLLAPLGALWQKRRDFGIGTVGAAAFIALQYVLMTFGGASFALACALDAVLFAALALASTTNSAGPRASFG
jgi:hypothetical protein